MARKKDIDAPPSRRSWRGTDRAKISIMQVFRSAHFEHDARKARERRTDGESEVTERSKQRRDGVSEDTLRAHLQADLGALLNTIRLDATVSLEDTPHVARSVANYGFQDLGAVTEADLNRRGLVDSIRQSLLDHEPRLIRDSVEVTLTTRENDARQRLMVSVSAELMGDPVDVPVDFAAEIDMGAGKLRMTDLQVQS